MLVKTLKKFYSLIFFYTLDIKNIIFNPKFYQHFLPSLLMSINHRVSRMLAELPTIDATNKPMQLLYEPRVNKVKEHERCEHETRCVEW